MRGRSKRIKRSVLNNPGSASGSGGYIDLNGSCNRIPESEAEYSFGAQPCSSDFCCFASRCSIRLIHEVVSKLDDQKKQLVKDIGFTGILSFPPFKQFNRKFVLWLMNSVDERSASLKILDHINIRFTKDDIGTVLGIPSSGLAVRVAGSSSRAAKDVVIQKFLGLEFKEHRSIKFVQGILDREYPCPMCKEDMDRWKVAFVVFIASSLLCPSSKYDYASIDYWNAIQCPEKIAMFDWADFVLEMLIDSVVKLKEDIASNIKFPNITGCAFFLMVFYLDSLDLGDLSLPHSCLPRAKEFNHDRLRAMILADRNFNMHQKATHPKQVSKLRQKVGCIYSWAVSGSVDETDRRSSCSLALWELCVAMVHLLNIPLEAAGPIFVAASDFQQQINRGLLVSGTQAIKFMTVLVSIMLPFRRGFSYHPHYLSNSNDRESIETSIANGISLLSEPLVLNVGSGNSVMSSGSGKDSAAAVGIGGSSRFGEFLSSASDGISNSLCSTSFGDNVQSAFRDAVSMLHDMPGQLSVDSRVASSMSQFYSIIRRLKLPLGFDLNVNSVTGCLDVGSSSSAMAHGNVSLLSPWDAGFSWPPNLQDRKEGLAKLEGLVNFECNVVVHCSPRTIKLSGSSVFSQCTGKCEFDSDLVDALVRSLRQIDDSLYDSFGKQRWRHIFESNFMGYFLSGIVDPSVSSLRQILMYSLDCYDLSRCKHMSCRVFFSLLGLSSLFFPAMLQCRWVCFVWSSDTAVLSVYEPSFTWPMGEERIQVIHRSCMLLKLVLQSLGPCFNVHSEDDLASAETRILTLSRAPTERLNRSGLLCSLFMRCFDGVDLTPSIETVDIESIVLSLYNELVGLKDNMAQFPG